MPNNSGPVVGAVTCSVRGTTTTHRSAITAADKLAAPTLTTLADNDDVVGVMAAAAHYAAVAPGNVYGTAGPSNIVNNTPTENKTADLTVPQVTGATYYDVFYSTDAAPLWVARITEAQRASGCAITAVGTVTTTDGDGWTKAAGKVNIRLVGTGVATTAAPFAANTAYYPTKSGISTLPCAGYQTAIVSASLALTDMRSAPTLKLMPFVSKKDATPTVWYAGTLQDLAPCTAGKCLYQTFTVDVRDATDMCILVDTISGQGATVTVSVELT